MNYNNSSNLVYNTGVYIRLSQEDKGKIYESDSESVINQKELLKNFCIKNGFKLICEYVDDGYSGTNYNRPAFKQMIKDIKDSKINLVIVKDLSRLGRDHVMTGYYIETFFPENKVRFISIMENYDSIKNQASNDSSTFIIACNDYYSKQNSLKIRSVLDSKRKSGKFIGSMPCYGYMRDPEDKGHLVPNPEVCDYVKKIFDWRIKGTSISVIATRLTKINAPTPSRYKMNSIREEKNIWSIHAVNNILKNRMYAGDMVQHKQTKINYKSNKKISLDKDSWIIVENTHEPLVDKNTFLLLSKEKGNTRICPKRKRPNRLLEGLLYCHECGNRLSVIHRKKQDYWYINCNKYSKDPIRRMCEPHFFSYNYFEELILKILKNSLKNLFDNLNIKELNNEIIKRNNYSLNEYNEKMKTLKKRQEKVLDNLNTLYKDRLDNNISTKQYRILSNALENDLNNLNTQIINTKNKYTSIEVNSINYINDIKKLLNLDSPSKNLLFTMIKRIEADKDKNITIKYKHNILDDYTFKYIDKRVRNPYGRHGKS